ncbi:holin-associated N-acetylmuramidase [Pseudooceanicola aestuarii]|uniref:holin-associated N-acetylmuramidase n=1 Tax=Pseudooceanicola aestuarii TaxID=2697319 RepID=UPI0013D26164|nr:holin-associated N-acetylmuramidase [Pseudooceanicola aestuarii]
MPLDVRTIAEEIVNREGGYVNDPDDPGGATKYGVTLAALRGLARDLTGDGRVDHADLLALNRDQAVGIFLEHYFHAPGLDALPQVLWDSIFDMQVNAGNRAVKLLQQVLRRMGWPLAIDGRVGPRTIAAAGQAAEAAPQQLRDAYAIARRNFYFRLADRRPASRKFARTRAGSKGGWILRAETFMSEKYHLSDADFRERTAHWAERAE